MRFRQLTLILASLISFIASASEAPASACSTKPFRQFDFWLGNWSVKGPKGKPAGTNVITSRHDGCALVEEWHSSSGKQGTSINYFDPSTSKWKQIWVSPDELLEM